MGRSTGRFLATAALAVVLVSVSHAAGGEDETAGSPGEGAMRDLAGQIVDAATGAGVPFASVGIPRLALGTVSAEDGRFGLDGARTDAELLVSAIGYQTRSWVVGEVPADGVLALQPDEGGFRERVTVTADATGRPRVFGKQYDPQGYKFGFGSGRLGAQIGARIKIDGPTYLESANFTVARVGGERFLYRVNVYDFSGKEIGENLLTRNLIVAATQERGVLSVDLREHGLIVKDDVLLTIEWVKDDREAGNREVMFSARPRSRSTLYYKPTSQMPFVRVPRHNVGFFLVGYSLE